LPELKTFLKDGHAESYEHVTVSYFTGHHRKPTLTIYDEDDNEIEMVDLEPTRTVEEIHDLFLSKGFTKKKQEEVEKILKERRVKKELDRKSRTEFLRGLKDKRERGEI
jgi:hypothetical protein